VNDADDRWLAFATDSKENSPATAEGMPGFEPLLGSTNTSNTTT
jgi:hypothetical protein